jgi:hypothetical protein
MKTGVERVRHTEESQAIQRDKHADRCRESQAIQRDKHADRQAERRKAYRERDRLTERQTPWK